MIEATKKITVLFSALIIGLLCFSMTPIQANADVGDVNVTVSQDGKLVVDGGGMSSAGTSSQAWNDLIVKYRGFIVGISGIGVVSMLLFFIMNFMKLGTSSGNPSERSKAITGLIFSGLAATGMGALTVIVGFFYSALK